MHHHASSFLMIQRMQLVLTENKLQPFSNQNNHQNHKRKPDTNARIRFHNVQTNQTPNLNNREQMHHFRVNLPQISRVNLMLFRRYYHQNPFSDFQINNRVDPHHHKNPVQNVQRYEFQNRTQKHRCSYQNENEQPSRSLFQNSDKTRTLTWHRVFRVVLFQTLNMRY